VLLLRNPTFLTSRVPRTGLAYGERNLPFTKVRLHIESAQG
jgi:hypothetical protein